MTQSCIKHSREIENHVEFPALSDSSYRIGIKNGVIASAGIRVGTTTCNHYSIANGLPDQEFFDIFARIRTSRPLEVH